jgi:hypothetical protein
MLCQLVCIDRRYQRMNCFNIRELQGILKRRFFTDLINTHEHHNVLNKSLINLRYKLNNSVNVNPDIFTYYNYNITSSVKNKVLNLGSNYYNNSLSLGNMNFKEIFFNYNIFMNGTNSITNVWFYLVNFVLNFSLFSIYSLIDFLKLFFINITINFNFLYFNINLDFLNFITVKTLLNTDSNIVSYNSNNIMSLGEVSNLTLMENSNNFRFLRFYNPLISYDYKCGHYLGIWEQLYPALINSYIEVGRGIRKAPWYYTDQYSDFLKLVLANHISTFTTPINLQLSEIENWYSSHVNPLNVFFNYIYELQNIQGFLTVRWIAFNALNQKFYKLINSYTIQQRVLANWRQLKFTREAWRCKLLSSHHQNTIYRRFNNEEGLVYAIERNAKDLIPGWAVITPFSSRTRYTITGRVDIALAGVLIVLNASIVSSVNFLVTYRYLSTLNNRKMRDTRSFFTEALIVGSWMIVFANPMLSIALVMLLSDRHWQTTFFDSSDFYTMLCILKPT